jgi:hypothetical protein
MAFAICPDEGLPRLWRFVEGGLPPGVISVLDAKQNLLCIDKELFGKLSELDQIQVLRTHARYEYAS